MKRTLIVLSFFLLPSVGFAAPLTTDQASSLIAVVQSSPTTPASAFTSLITAFSNITTAQADSLIAVVQAAPGVPPSAFINMLIAFTADAPTTTQPTLGSAPVIPTPTNTNTQQPAPEPVPEPVVVPVDKSEIVIQSAKRDGDGVLFYVSKLDSEGRAIKFANITMQGDDIEPIAGVAHARQTNTDPNWIAGFWYAPKTPGEKTITFTSGGLTKTTIVSF